MPNVYHVSSPSASLLSSTQQAGWYSTGIFYKGRAITGLALLFDNRILIFFF
jgi:hypothetical protein